MSAVVSSSAKPASSAGMKAPVTKRGAGSVFATSWKFINSSVGRKWTMAVTGTLLYLFVLQHMLANLQLFLGPEALNAYAYHLKELGPLLWVGRIGLLVLIVVHILLGLSITRINQTARPVPYAYERTLKASWASRTMLQTGLLVLAFILFHLAHFTFFWVGTPVEGLDNYQAWRYYDLHGIQVDNVYNRVVWGFQIWWITLGYIVAQIILYFHLSHAGSSIFRTFGLTNKRFGVVTDWVGPVLASIILAGNVIMPLAVLFRFVQPVGV